MPSRPLYQIIKEQILQDYLLPLEQGGRLPTERELQDRYRVSRPTVSKALTELTGEGYLVREHRRGTFAARPDSGARPSQPPRIGFVAPLAGQELVQRTFLGVDRVAHRHGCRVLMGSAGNDTARERQAALDFLASGVAGLIITPFPRRHSEAAGDYLDGSPLPVPVVLLDTCVPSQGHTQVIFDNRRLGRAVAAHLIQSGHRRVALLTYPEDLEHGPLVARLAGYHDALHEAGLPARPELVRRVDSALPHSPALGAILDDWLALPDPPTAVIAPEDIMAMELIDLLSARGVRVPDDLAIAGFDNRSAACRLTPPIPTSAPDFERMGETACRLLLETIAGTVLPARTVILDVPLFLRKPVPAAPVAAGLLGR